MIINAETRLQDIIKEFSEYSEFVALRLFPIDEMERAKKNPGDPSLNLLDYTKTIRECATKDIDADCEISIEYDMRVGNIEEDFLETFGIYAQVCFVCDGDLMCSNPRTDEYMPYQFDDGDEHWRFERIANYRRPMRRGPGMRNQEPTKWYIGL